MDVRAGGAGSWQGNNRLNSFPRCPSTPKRSRSQEAGRRLGPEPVSLQSRGKELWPQSQDTHFLTHRFAVMPPNEGETLGGLCLEGLRPVSTTPFAMGLRDSRGSLRAQSWWGGEGSPRPHRTLEAFSHHSGWVSLSYQPWVVPAHTDDLSSQLRSAVRVMPDYHQLMRIPGLGQLPTLRNVLFMRNVNFTKTSPVCQLFFPHSGFTADRTSFHMMC